MAPQPGPGPGNGVSGEGGRPPAQKRLCQLPFFPAPRCGQRGALTEGCLWLSEAKRVGKAWEARVKVGRAAESQRSTAGTAEGGGPCPALPILLPGQKSLSLPPGPILASP